MPLLTTATARPPAPPTGRVSVAPVITWTSADGVVTTLRVLAGARGLGMAPYELFTQSSSAVDGDEITGVRAQPREIMLPILLEASTRAEFIASLNGLVRHMRPKRGDGTITVAQRDGETRSIRARYVEGLEGSESKTEAGVTWWKAGLLFHASQPYWRGRRYENEWGTAGTTQDFFPFGPEWQVRNSQVIGLGMEIPNDGDVEAYPLWEIDGPVGADSVFRNTMLGQEWGLGRSLSVGDTAVVDCRQRVQTATLNGSTDLWPDLTDDAVLWPMAPGVNEVDLVLSGTTDDTRVRLSFDQRYEIAYA